MSKLIWRVSPAPQGRFRSFEYREWPTAYLPNDQIAFTISCEEEYIPSKVRSGDHPPLKLRVADYRPSSNKAGGAFTWATLKASFATLDELKHKAQVFADSYPQLFERRSNTKEST